MKHKIIIILSLLIMGNIPLLADENYYGVAILSHQGNETAYAADNVQAAVDAAVEGDIITFSPGQFKEFTLNKLVYLKNYDWASINVNLDFPDNSVISNSFFSGGWFYVNVKNNVQSIYFSECSVNLSSDNGISIGKVIFDRCAANIYYNQFNANTIELNNCDVHGIYNGENTTIVSKFINSRIYSAGVVGASFENCIFVSGYEEAKTIDGCTLTNCLYNPDEYIIGEGSTVTDCYTMSTEEWDESSDNLLSKGFVGTDGTIVGFNGGTTPFNGTSPKEGTSVWSNGNLKYQDGKLTGTYYINPTR